MAATALRQFRHSGVTVPGSSQNIKKEIDIATDVHYCRNTHRLSIDGITTTTRFLKIHTDMTRPDLQFAVHPSSGVPIYRQLMDQVRALVASGRLSPGELVPSVRQLADDLQVNMMTISKAYAKLEADGVLERDRGVGMRVKAARISGSAAERQAELKPEADLLAAKAWQLQLTQQQTLAVVKAALKNSAGQGERGA